jgi:hypothetical protein
VPRRIELRQGEHPEPDRQDVDDGAALTPEDVLAVAAAIDRELHAGGAALVGGLGPEADGLLEHLLEGDAQLLLDETDQLVEERLAELLEGGLDGRRALEEGGDRRAIRADPLPLLAVERRVAGELRHPPAERGRRPDRGRRRRHPSSRAVS